MKLLLNTPHFQETLNAGMCGPAALKIVCDYFDVPMTEKELAKLCGTTKDNGTTGKQLVVAAKKLGFKAAIRDYSTYKDIERLLKAGVPPIVDWFSAEGTVADGHFSVVCGLTTTHIILEDPEIGRRRKITRDDFMRVWFDFDVDTLRRPSDILIRRLIVIRPEHR